MSVELTVEAQDDMWAIYLFGLQRWGDDQADKYQTRLESALLRLSEHPFIGISIDGEIQSIRVLPVERHNIYYQIESNAILVLRVVHSGIDRTRVSDLN